MFVCANGDDFPHFPYPRGAWVRRKKGGMRVCFLQTCRSSGAEILSQEIPELRREKHKAGFLKQPD
jgi:hypothetical protein